MNLDLLLFWLSARKNGTETQLRTAINELCIPESSKAEQSDNDRKLNYSSHRRIVWSLTSLSHLEPFLDGQWRVVPPIIAVNTLTNKCSSAVLCGARTPAILAKLSTYCGITYETSNHEGMPRRIVLKADDARTLHELASSCHLRFQDTAPEAILLASPPIMNSRHWIHRELPPTQGWKVEKFASSTLSWQDASASDAMRSSVGLFRFSQSFQRLYFLRAHSSFYQMPVEVAKFAFLRLRNKRVIEYHETSNTFILPITCRPPTLVERALILSSGALPRVDFATRSLTYADVSPTIASLAAKALCQGLI